MVAADKGFVKVKLRSRKWITPSIARGDPAYPEQNYWREPFTNRRVIAGDN
jgi:hypothetical protein